jgi:multiple sugar transport system substrate-binding protein
LPVNDVVTECDKEVGEARPLGHLEPAEQELSRVLRQLGPRPIHYRKDWWDDVGVKPDTREKVREGAKKIKDEHGAPAGFALARELDTNMMVHALWCSYGAAEQDEAGSVTINSKATVEAIKPVEAIKLLQGVGNRGGLTWDRSSDTRFFQSPARVTAC